MKTRSLALLLICAWLAACAAPPLPAPTPPPSTRLPTTATVTPAPTRPPPSLTPSGAAAIALINGTLIDDSPAKTLPRHGG